MKMRLPLMPLRRNLCILADGMGGYNAGEIASGMATAFIKSEFARWLSQAGKHCQRQRGVGSAMEICVENANHSIFNAANSNPAVFGHGHHPGRRGFSGRAADARPYRRFALLPLEGCAQLQQITKDHSLLQEQIDAGLITPEQALTSVNKNLVTRALGVEDAVLLEVNEHRVELG